MVPIGLLPEGVHYDYNERVAKKPLKLQKAFLLTGLIEFYNEEVVLNGGPLHIILEDGNFGKHSIKACKDHINPNDYITNLVLSLMEEFNEDQLEVIVDFPKKIKHYLNGCNPSFNLEDWK